VEIMQKGLRQVQVNPKIGYTFANAMRAFLRADPDVIMVGEMRDQETAAIGIEASLTGHLVMSTLHTNSAPDSIQRLLNMGMDRFNFSDALLGILAQRLARRLCTSCRTPYTADQRDLEELLNEFILENSPSIETEQDRTHYKEALQLGWKAEYGDDDGNITLYQANGCAECHHTGYRDRIALHETLVASDRIKEHILKGDSANRILASALEEGMTTLKQDGIQKVLQGHTDLQQVRRVCIK
jgi:type II secretory ATPase GspE/PulE/Tfp pilus assembly ATPase PilB-like protein